MFAPPTASVTATPFVGHSRRIQFVMTASENPRIRWWQRDIDGPIILTFACCTSVAVLMAAFAFIIDGAQVAALMVPMGVLCGSSISLRISKDASMRKWSHFADGLLARAVKIVLYYGTPFWVYVAVKYGLGITIVSLGAISALLICLVRLYHWLAAKAFGSRACRQPIRWPITPSTCDMNPYDSPESEVISRESAVHFGSPNRALPNQRDIPGAIALWLFRTGIIWAVILVPMTMVSFLSIFGRGANLWPFGVYFLIGFAVWAAGVGAVVSDEDSPLQPHSGWFPLRSMRCSSFG